MMWFQGESKHVTSRTTYLNGIKRADPAMWLRDDPSLFYRQSFAPLVHRVRQQIIDQDMWRRADHTHAKYTDFSAAQQQPAMAGTTQARANDDQ